MHILHLTKSEYQTSQWSGGTTTELFIWPQDADYASRKFSLRISSATVELPESDFTPLAGVERYIMPLEGSFTLTHPQGEPVALTPWAEPYRFSGETPTHCVGTATDFNLMLKGVAGRMALCSGEAPLRPGMNAFYPGADTVFTLGGRSITMARGDLLVVRTAVPGTIDLGSGQTVVCWAAAY